MINYSHENLEFILLFVNELHGLKFEPHPLYIIRIDITFTLYIVTNL